MKKVHIIVKDGLVQSVYADAELDIEDVVILDMDTEDEAIFADNLAAVRELTRTATIVY